MRRNKYQKVTAIALTVVLLFAIVAGAVATVFL